MKLYKATSTKKFNEIKTYFTITLSTNLPMKKKNKKTNFTSQFNRTSKITKNYK